MSHSFILQGRTLGPPELTQITTLIGDHPDWTRFRLSRELALLWDWRTHTGQLKDMAARTLMLKLHERGLIPLPARRRDSPNRMRRKQVPALPADLNQNPIQAPLKDLLPLDLQEVSSHPSDRSLFDALLHQFHYLSYRSPVGENLQYLVRERSGRPVAALLFGAAAWQCADRDCYIGWDALTRAARLHLLTNNTRFLILPWVEVSCLASLIMGRVLKRIQSDWQRKYGHPVHLLETFVERDRFRGTCYKASNWFRVGQTKGRTRQDQADGKRYCAPIKDIYLYPLGRRSTQHLQQPLP